MGLIVIIKPHKKGGQLPLLINKNLINKCCPPDNLKVIK
jgi:hypothetical protein